MQTHQRALHSQQCIVPTGEISLEQVLTLHWCNSPWSYTLLCLPDWHGTHNTISVKILAI